MIISLVVVSILSIVGLLVARKLFAWWSHPLRTRNDFPLVPSAPFVGPARRLADTKSLHRHLEQLAEQTAPDGRPMRMQIAGDWWVLLRAAADVRHVLGHRPAMAFLSDAWKQAFHESGLAGLPFIDEEEWTRARHALAPTLTLAALAKQYATWLPILRRFGAVVSRAVDAGDGVVSVLDVAQRFALDVVCRVALDVDTRSLEPPTAANAEGRRLVAALRAVFDGVAARAALGQLIGAYWRFVWLPSDYRMRDGMAAVGDVVRRRMSEHVGHGEAAETILSMLSEAGTLSYDEVLANMSLFVLAGGDTTASSICYVLMYAAKYAHVQRALQDEADRVVGGGADRAAADDGIARTTSEHAALRYTRAVWRESLRVRSAAPLQLNVLKTDATLPSTGQWLPAGTTVACMLRAANLGDATGAADGADFRPERWLDDDTLSDVSFGYGRRVCIGRHLAQNEALAAVAYLARHFDWTFVRDEWPGEVFAMAMSPAPFELRFTRRRDRK